MGKAADSEPPHDFFDLFLDKRSATEVDGPASGGATFTRSFNKPATGTVQYKRIIMD
jgi:hypothetical protein